MTYKSVHQHYSQSIKVSGEYPIAYRTFLRIWQTEFSSIRFNNPRSDLCMTCEDFKKRLNQITATLDCDKEKEQSKIHKEALAHFTVSKERKAFLSSKYKSCERTL